MYLDFQCSSQSKFLPKTSEANPDFPFRDSIFKKIILYKKQSHSLYAYYYKFDQAQFIIYLCLFGNCVEIRKQMKENLKNKHFDQFEC